MFFRCRHETSVMSALEHLPFPGPPRKPPHGRCGCATYRLEVESSDYRATRQGELRMRIGLIGAGATADRIVQQAKRAEADGFTSMWYPSATGGGDPLAALALAGRATSSIELGTAVLVTYACHPVLQANRANATASAIGTPGRLTLGVGPSHRVVIEDLLGLSYDTPGRHTDQYVQILTGLLRGEQVSFTGQEFRVAAGPL